MPGKPLLPDHLEDGESRGAGDRVSAEGVEVLHPGLEGPGEFPGGDDGPERMSVPGRFPERDDVRNPWFALVLHREKGPEVRPRPAEAGLHLVRHDHAPGAPHGPVEGSQVPRRRHDLAAAAQDGLPDQRRRPRPLNAGLGVRDQRRREVRLPVPEAPAVPVGHGQPVEPRRPGPSSPAIELVGADVDEGREVAVIAALERQGFPPPEVGPGNAEREVVRFAAGVREEDHLERRGEGLREAFGIVGELAIEVAGVRVEEGGLAGDGVRDPRVRMPHVSDVVDHVEVVASRVVVEAGAAAPYHPDGNVVGDAEGVAEPPPAGLEQAAAARLADFGENAGAGTQAEEVQGIGAQGGKDRQVGGGAPPRRPAAERAQQHLELEVGRRVAARVGLRDGAERLSGLDAAPRNQRLPACGVEMAVGGPEDLPVHGVADAGGNARSRLAGAVVRPFHRSGERRPHRCPGGSEDLDAQLEGGGCRPRPPGNVPRHRFGDPWFEIPADGDARRLGGRPDGRAEGLGGGGGIDRRALRRKVQADRGPWQGYGRGGGRGGALKGGLPLRQPRQGRKAGGDPEPGRGDFGRFRLEGPEDAPHPGLAHHQILIRRRSGNAGPPQRRDPGAHQRAGRERDSEEVGLLLGERPFARESGEDPRGGRQRLEGGGGGVEGGRRRFTDQRAPDGVSEVQERDVLRLRRLGGSRGEEEEVVVVGVVVKRAGGKGQDVRQVLRDGVGDASVDPGGVLSAEDSGSGGDDRRGVRRRPGNLLDVQFGMIETVEGALHPADEPADGFQQGVGTPAEGRERPALEVAKQTHAVPAPAEVAPRRQDAGFGRDGFREAEGGIALAGPRDEAVLQVEPPGPLRRAADLEHEAVARVALQQEVGVALAGERGGARRQSPQFPRGGRRLVNGDPRPVPQGVDGEGKPPGRRHQRSRSRRSPSLPR